MLSNDERETLSEVERRLTAEDPAFARSFDDIRHSNQDEPEFVPWLCVLPRWVYTTVLVVFTLLAGLMVAVQAVGSVVLFTILAATVGFLRHHRIKEDRTGG